MKEKIILVFSLLSNVRHSSPSLPNIETMNLFLNFDCENQKKLNFFKFLYTSIYRQGWLSGAGTYKGDGHL